MTRLMILSTVAVATLSLAACGSNEDTAYLGSRDDIIVNNRNMPEEASKAEVEKKIETVKVDAEAKAQMTAEEKRIAAQEAAIAEAKKMDAKTETVKVSTADGITTMKTTPKGIVETTEAKMASTEPAAAPEPAKKVAMSEPVIPSNMQGDVPPNARPGECYAKVLIPAVKDTKSERVQVAEERKVLARIIPAKYEVKTERVLVTPARKYWKAGHGPITKKDQVTGEIMCLVEEPAQYKTIEKRVLVEPEKPEYKMMPAQFETITTSNIIKPESWEWRRILCETNMGSDSVVRIQRALNAKGYNLAIDGKLGNDTMSALNNYNRKNGLPTRGITYETLDHLGVKLIGA